MNPSAGELHVTTTKDAVVTGCLCTRARRPRPPRARLARMLATLLLGALVLRSADAVVLGEDLNFTDYQGQVVACAHPEVAENNTCVCSPGFTRADDACTSCALGTYKEASGDHPCTSCPEHHTTFPNASEASDCICTFGYEPPAGASAGACLPCGIGAYKNFKGNNSCLSCTPNATTALAGSLYASDCTCLPGFEGAFDTGCSACPRDSFRAPADSACRPCPANSGTPAPAAASEAACVCKAGFHPEPATAQCVACPADTYKPELASSPCSACPANATSPAASSSREQCTCDPGFSHDYSSGSAFSCAACAAGSWCPGQRAVHPCPASSLSSPGATALEQCICTSSMFMQDGTCFDCPADFYCPGDNQKHACPGHSAAPQRSSALADCVCDGGFEKQSPAETAR
jgi:hypothetical protein